MLVAKAMAPMKGERSFVFTIGPPAPNLGADLFPIVSVILDGPTIEEFATFLEQRGSVEFLIRRLEDLDAGEASSEPAEPGQTPASDAESEVGDDHEGVDSDEKGS